MTFQASRNNRFVETRPPIGIARTIHPLIGFCPIGDGQLKEFIVLPIQIGLPLSPRANHEIEAFLVRDGLDRRELSDCALEVAFLRCTHHKIEIWV
jgi:hypothetical protein